MKFSVHPIINAVRIDYKEKLEMNTLPKQVRESLFDSKEAYLEFVAYWKRHIRAGVEMDFGCHFVYCCLRGKDYRKAFPLATNRQKQEHWADLTNGSFHDTGFQRGLKLMAEDLGHKWRRKYIAEAFGGTITVDTLSRLSSLLPPPCDDPGAIEGYLQNDSYCVMAEGRINV